MNAVAIVPEFREVTGSNGPELGSFLSRGDGGGERVVPKSPAKGARGVCHPTGRPWPLGLWRKSCPSQSAYTKGARVHRTGIVATCMLGAKLPGPNQTWYGKEGITPWEQSSVSQALGEATQSQKRKGGAD